MLRLPAFALERPTSLAEACAILAESGGDAVVIAGGTDLVPNMKHGLVTPQRVVSLGAIEELRGITLERDGSLSIGAMTTLAELANDERVAARAPALAQAASLVAGPQLRTMGTLGGNVLLDTRCQWINQSHFWRKSLGYCLKKDGTLCHVVEGGRKCVAAASNDTAPALMTLGAELELVREGATRRLAIDDLWLSDGIFNKRLEPGEILARVRVPAAPAGHRGAYGKLRERGSIDFPLLGVAARVDFSDARVSAADLVVTALAAAPKRVARASETLLGLREGSSELEAAIEDVAELAWRQCKPLPNIPGDADWRREMVPVYVRRTLRAALAGTGPVHHI
jgi:4-hydroxybenzoyl-CoA reductase subunit beta